MENKPLLWFALGIATVVAIGGTNGLVLRNDGIEFPDSSLQTTAAAAGGRQSYYLTTLSFTGGNALGACATGYHMASLFEILDPSNLRYATEETDAATQSDSGAGPPADLFGWVRTGEKTPLTGEADLGEANCLVWTSSSSAENGTRMELEDKWANFPTIEIAPWDVEVEPCDDPFADTGVWCVED